MNGSNVIYQAQKYTTLKVIALIAFAAIATLLLSSRESQAASVQCGKASWYDLTSKTASGEYANPKAMTAAHRTLPFGTKVRVTNKNNGKSVILRINDRGPFIRGRIIDVTKGAAYKLGFVNNGVTNVKVEPLNMTSKQLSC
jgi:rare lipoprotein A